MKKLLTALLFLSIYTAPAIAKGTSPPRNYCSLVRNTVVVLPGGETLTIPAGTRVIAGDVRGTTRTITHNGSQYRVPLDSCRMALG